VCYSSSFGSLVLAPSHFKPELALYTLPRAVDSFYMQLLGEPKPASSFYAENLSEMLVFQDRKWMASVPHGDLVLFCTAMSGLAYFYHNQVLPFPP